MKRTLCIILTLFLVCIPFTIGCLAAENVSISGSTIKCQPGQTIDVEIKVSADSNIAAANIDLSYDSSMFTFQKFTVGEPLKGSAMADGNGKTSGVVKFAIVTLEPVTAEGTLFHTYFVVNRNTAGEASMDIKVDPIVDINSKALATSVQNATVTVSGSPVAESKDSDTKIEVVTENGITTVDTGNINKNETNSYTDKIKNDTSSANNGDVADVDNGNTASSSASDAKSSSVGKTVIIILCGIVAAVAIVVVIILIIGKKKSNKSAEQPAGESILSDTAKKELEEDSATDALEEKSTASADEPVNETVEESSEDTPSDNEQ